MVAPSDWIKDRPCLSLSLTFIAWKVIILSIAFFSPGIGYDTSTSLLDYASEDGRHFDDVLPNRLSLPRKLVRWDALYYIHLASQGHVFEQEWAFGTGLPTTIASLTHLIPHDRVSEIDDYVWTGVLVSHGAHWLAVILVWLIASECIEAKDGQSASSSFIAAMLHIISPAGIFLSAPYSESLFACLNLLGFYSYITGTATTKSATTPKVSIRRVAAGLVFGCAAMIRSNGLFSGLPFLIDAVIYVLALGNKPTNVQAASEQLQNLLFTVLGGICIAVGAVIPQFLAYQQFCVGTHTVRPWCTAIPPSIYTFVQSHYWNVGFLRYWTLSNIPLFLLAVPVLYLMVRSGLESCFLSSTTQPRIRIEHHAAIRLALPQLLLAVLAFTNFHVQVITRLASAYPLWYIWLATNLHEPKKFKLMVRIMVMYGVIQAALYASFLPPA